MGTWGDNKNPHGQLFSGKKSKYKPSKSDHDFAENRRALEALKEKRSDANKFKEVWDDL